MIFKQPYYVTPHAVKQFRKRVARLPTRKIRTIIQAALQDNRQRVFVQNWNKKQCPIYRAKYQSTEFLIPVLPRDKPRGDVWPVVPTILLPNMRTNVFKERRGWNWNC